MSLPILEQCSFIFEVISPYLDNSVDDANDNYDHNVFYIYSDVIKIVNYYTINQIL